ncbi:hypothetical protein [Streptosporangium sp. NPDC049046]|uniref:hypothetical protein n=1 Tax=Streptosporangium sp. NPDC049046 TaxID=3155031 RepID=UPI00341F818B
MTDQEKIIQLLRGIYYRSPDELSPTGENAAIADDLRVLLCASPQLFEDALLHELPEEVLKSNSVPDIVCWVISLDRLLGELAVSCLPVVFGIVQGLIDAECTRRALKLRTWHLPYEDDSELRLTAELTPQVYHIATLWHTLAVIAFLPHNYKIERVEQLRSLEREVENRPDSWTQSLPWVLTVGPSLNDLDITMTLWLRERHPAIADCLKDIVGSSSGRMELRARGIEAVANGIDPVMSQEWLLDAAAKLLDQRRHLFPRPLEAPSATWLGDPDVESMLRGASYRAVQEFADVVAADGAAEEEGLTQNLLARLAKHIEAVHAAIILAGPFSSKPRIEVERRTVPKKEESKIGADIGIVVSVEIPSYARIRFGDLIQVKKSNLLREPGPGADSWVVAIGQLEDLLRCSATAVYWMIAQDGTVHVVPAKMLMALRHGRGKQNAGSFTVRYSDIRHVGIQLGHYLCDVLLGMWVASSNSEILSIADGSNSRTSPLHLLSISIRIAN